MLHPTTRAKNANQHPGNIILEGKQKKRTPEEKQADDARAEQQRQEQAAERERGIKRLANIMDQVEKDEERLLTQPPKPKPRLRLILKGPAEPSTTSEDPGNNLSATEMAIDDFLEDQGNDVQGLNNDGPAPTQTSRKPRSQKTSSRNAVQAARCELIEGTDIVTHEDEFDADEGQKRKVSW